MHTTREKLLTVLIRDTQNKSIMYDVVSQTDVSMGVFFGLQIFFYKYFPAHLTIRSAQ